MALNTLSGSKSKREGALQEARKAVFRPSAIKKYIGMDVTSLLSVPLFIMEPLSMLQKMAEIMEYTELLDAANRAADPHERLALVAAFLVSPFGAAERAWKPFNPILGETFEMDGFGNDVHYFAEQVSHHPPVGAAHAENQDWAYDLVSAPTTRFLGNSLEVFPRGRTRITLKKTGEVFSHVPPHAKVHNIVLGRTWVDSFGTFHVLNAFSGGRCTLEYKPCGWFNQGHYEFEGYVTDAVGRKHLYMFGKWNSHVDVQACSSSGQPDPSSKPRRLWTCRAKPSDDHYGLTYFARQLNTCQQLTHPPLPSDSRRRPDRLSLEVRRMGQAGAEKQKLEEQQRTEQRHRATVGANWKPRWFEAAPEMQVLPGEESTEHVPLWRWIGNKQQQEQEQQVEPVGSNWREQVPGSGFCPWEYPHIHKQK